MLRMFGIGLLSILIGGALLVLNPQPVLEAAGSSPLNLNVQYIMTDTGELVLLRDLAGELNWGLTYLPREEAVLIKSGDKEEKLGIADNSLNGRELKTAPRIIAGRTWIDLETAGRLLRNLDSELEAIITGLYSRKDTYRQGEDITVQIKAYNPTDKTLQLDFSSGQRYDLYLKQGDEEVWRWSDGRFFTMALARIELKPGEELAYELKIPTEGLAPGDYTVGGELSTLKKSLELGGMGITISL